MTDDLDAIMAVMNAAFDPAFGEAWTRRQVEDTLLLPGTACLLAGPDGEPPAPDGPVAGFALTRCVLDEEELLLLAVEPRWHRRGIGRRLLQRVIADADTRGIARLFLEMRDGNDAAHLYAAAGFAQVGRRTGYYRRGSGGPFDAITCAMSIPRLASSNIVS